MDISVSLPLDADGFLRRQCPKCRREFKWHHGPTDDRPADWIDPPAYWCPLCGIPSANDQFLTEEQVEFIQQAAAGPAMDMIADELKRSFRGVKGVSFKKGSGRDRPEPPTPLVEPDDMNQIMSPCHPWEPVKVPEDAQAPYHCLVCGQAFAV